MTTDPSQQVAATEHTFAALSHASRRQILLTLHFRGGQMSAGDIANRFACSWPTTTRHLNILRESGLISVKKVGRERMYTLERELLLATLGEWINWFDQDIDDK